MDGLNRSEKQRLEHLVMSDLNDSGIEHEVKVERHSAIAWDEFLSSCPPGKHALIRSLSENNFGERGFVGIVLSTPILRLECHSEQCDYGVRNFACADKHVTPSKGWGTYFLSYDCRDCRNQTVVFALAVKLQEMPSGGDWPGEALKIGQWPPFGPSVPPRVISLIGPDRELFLKGRRAESHGMGIGAFGYYRRVVENQKDRLLDQIAKVAKRCGASTDMVSTIERAKMERQFARAIDSVKDAVPEVLRIDGHNPLTLLHSALSQGLHAESDESCLDLAKSIRVVLADLADRIGQALKERAELETAVSHLLKATEGTNHET